MKKAVLLAACVAVGLCACQSRVAKKVAYDFGFGEKPEGYVTPSEKIQEKLDGVARSEMKRMNTAARKGEVKYQEQGNLEGKYYKESKVYEAYNTLDVRPMSRGAQSEQSYAGFIAYTYRIYQSERKASRAEAAAASADISTPETGQETYRYKFGAGGNWDGRKGELTKD